VAEAPGSPKRPAAVNLAAVVLVVLALLEVGLASLFVLNQAELARSIARTYPYATAAEHGERLLAATFEGILVHAMLTGVYLASAWSLRSPGNAVRILVTALAVVATLTDGLILGQLPAALPSQAALIYVALAITTLLRLTVIALLWLRPSARAWYARK
jgi:hypothetical protein